MTSTSDLVALPRDIQITKVDHNGTPKITYPGELVYQDAETIAARCDWTQPYSLDLGLFALAPGDVFIEYYYTSDWFNVFAIYDRIGRLKGWYCNITHPVEITDAGLRWHDLALDLLALPTGQAEVLDRDEFEALHPTPYERQEAEAALAKLQRWLTAGSGPFWQRQGLHRQERDRLIQADSCLLFLCFISIFADRSYRMTSKVV